MMETESEVDPKDLLSSSGQITAVAKNAAFGSHLIRELSKFEEAQDAKKKPLKRLKPAAEKVADLAKKVREADVRKGRDWSYCGLARLCSQHRGFTPAHLR